MGSLITMTNVTLDGVMQAPGRADEDTRGGFTRGGWAVPYAAMAHAGGVSATGGLLFGRRTYEDFFSVWPQRKESPFSAILDNATKYVASRTLQEPLPWINSTLLRGEAGQTVAELKTRVAGDLLIMGSGALIRSLLAHGLIDRCILLIHPLVLGSGTRFFPAEGPASEWNLVESRTTPSGVVIATYGVKP